MTARDEARSKCIEAMEEAFLAKFYLKPPISPVIRKFVRECITAAFDSLNGIAWVIPIEATNGSRPLRHGNIENNDLTNPPEEKP